MIIRRYTTDNPKLERSTKLKKLMKFLTKLDEKIFKKRLEDLEVNYKDFLLERNEQGEFMHKNLRKAFRSLHRNLAYLFTYRNHPKLNIPNTTNSIESNFSHWKSKVQKHPSLDTQPS